MGQRFWCKQPSPFNELSENSSQNEVSDTKESVDTDTSSQLIHLEIDETGDGELDNLLSLPRNPEQPKWYLQQYNNDQEE